MDNTSLHTQINTRLEEMHGDERRSEFLRRHTAEIYAALLLCNDETMDRAGDAIDLTENLCERIESRVNMIMMLD